jgi:K+-transporting ATPase ATPase A chain
MAQIDVLQVVFYLLVLLLLTPPLGAYMARVYEGDPHWLSRIFGPFERLIYRLCFIDPREEMTWQRYAISLVLFSFFGLVATFFLQLLQNSLPLNPENLGNVSWPLAINTAISFVTNTNWQAYSGENTLSYLTQGLGLGVQNFVSAASGMAVLLVLMRGLTRKETRFLGNFWVDITRSVLYILLPLSLMLALVLISQGVPQNFLATVNADTLEGLTQNIPMGPAASQIAIKQLGTNGGGFFGTNSAHPFENPTALANFLEMLAILLIPSAMVYMFGRMTRAPKHALAIYVVMGGILIASIGAGLYAEFQANQSLSLSKNLEGKEIRLGIANSVLWAMATTAASNGSVNAMHDSLSPLAGGIALLQIVTGEVIFGGVGAGLYGMLLFVLLTVFLAGLMVGRTPEYFGKKIEAYEIQWVLVALLVPSATVLIGSSLTLLWPQAVEALVNLGPHGLTEIVYAWGSTANNNGSAFGGLLVNTNFFNIGLSLAMLIGRFLVIIPVLAIAGSLVTKKTVPASPATFDTSGATFAILLVSVILIVGALTFMPALVLGPVAEHLLMNEGRSF